MCCLCVTPSTDTILDRYAHHILHTIYEVHCMNCVPKSGSKYGCTCGAKSDPKGGPKRGISVEQSAELWYELRYDM